MEPFMLLLNLILGILGANLSAFPPLLLSTQPRTKLFVLLLEYAKGLTGLDTKVAFEPSLFLGIFHPLLGHKDLWIACTKMTDECFIK